MNAILLTGYDKVRYEKVCALRKKRFHVGAGVEWGWKKWKCETQWLNRQRTKSTVAVETFLNEFHFLNDLVASCQCQRYMPDWTLSLSMMFFNVAYSEIMVNLRVVAPLTMVWRLCEYQHSNRFIHRCRSLAHCMLSSCIRLSEHKHFHIIVFNLDCPINAVLSWSGLKGNKFSSLFPLASFLSSLRPFSVFYATQRTSSFNTPSDSCARNGTS